MTRFNHRDALGGVLRTAVRARETDDLGRFPREAVRAAGRAGLLGLTLPTGLGGGGGGLVEAVEVVTCLARECASSAAVLAGHYAATAVLVGRAPGELLRQIASGEHLSALALAESGPRPLVPAAGARAHGGVVDLAARKTWVSAAGEADSYVWSSLPVGQRGGTTLWLVPAQAPGVCVPAEIDGVGLRGSAAAAVTADPVRVPESAVLGGDGAGTEIVLGTALPWHCALQGGLALGIMEAVLQRSVECVTGPQPSWARWQGPPAQQPEVRADLARMRAEVDAARLLLADAVGDSWHGGADLQRVLQARAITGERAVAVAELGMKVCGQFAFRKEFGLERRFRDAHTSAHGQISVDEALDLQGRVICGLAVLG
ncbi:acyl-CoA dehydrogenase family protein [Saccharopolyspora griseoalba]|uniref:Acyl-CoA dehydrogenase family protein n=1 Tax=Saccharopolyspora griseoalba TaxID=1431848 RepID=A0ABW2LDG1_9PSEU